MKFLLTGQESERLLFRKLEHSDFEMWVKLFEDENTTKMLGMSEFKNPSECCEKWFEWTFNRYENNLGGQNILLCKESNQIIGQCGLLVREIENKFEIEIAYSILQEFRGRGYAIESAETCRDFAFKNNFHERFVSIINPENKSSKNVATKNGMTFLKQVNFSNSKMDLFQITKYDWEKIKMHEILL